MKRAHPVLDQALREPGALIVALIIGLAAAVSMLSAYHEFIAAPEIERRAQLEQTANGGELLQQHRSARCHVDGAAGGSITDQQQCENAMARSTVSLSK